MMAEYRFEMDGITEVLIDAICEVSSEISWSSKALKTFDLIRTAYGLFNHQENHPDYAINLTNKIKELEKLLRLDLEYHMALYNGREPYYFIRMDKPLQRVLDSALSLEGESFPAKDFDHLAAELQAAFVEYGFCAAIETIYSDDEAVIKLDALSRKLSTTEKAIAGEGDISLVLRMMHDILAELLGIRQAMTDENITKLKKKFIDMFERINQMEHSITDGYIRSDSKLFLRYRAGQHLLRRRLVDDLCHTDNTDIINGHMIHPGTRVWILERFNRCLSNQEKRVFFLSGKHGSGKTALASAICKLNPCTVASHFFDDSRGKHSQLNTINGLIQGLANAMCYTLPEYLNYLDDKFGQSDITEKLSESWRTSYELLIREPVQALYGIGKQATKLDVRKLIVIDALDECRQSEWPELKAFLATLVKDTPPPFSFFLTVRSKHSSSLLPQCDLDSIEGIGLEEKTWSNRHIKDIEVYLSSSLGAILSGEDEKDTPTHAKADVMTLQNSIDELLKSSAGRFDYAVDLMETFAREMSSSGQFLGSLKKALLPIKRAHGNAFEQKVVEFASPYRSYRDKEGRSVDVRVMRQSQYLKDKTRVALIRGRHRVQTSAQNGGQ